MENLYGKKGISGYPRHITRTEKQLSLTEQEKLKNGLEGVGFVEYRAYYYAIGRLDNGYILFERGRTIID